MAKGILADIRSEEHLKSLKELSDRDLCEMIRAHFESHTTLPGEKVMKDQVNQLITLIELDNQFSIMPEEKDELVRKYAQTRIRETPLKEGNHYFDFRNYDPTALERHPVTEVADVAGNPVYISRVNAELQNNNNAGEVNVVAELYNGRYTFVGSLPDNFLKNNPMNVDSCTAELEIADYSNGQMKNLSVRVVADTDLMSGDVVDLNENMMAGLDQESGLEQ